MSTNNLIRPVRLDDAEQILKIYGPFVLNTAASFETAVPSVEAFKKRIEDYTKTSDWLVLEEDNRICGYAYATKHRSRQAYQWNEEVTVYVDPSHHNKGYASMLYKELFARMKTKGIQKALAIITLPNEPSILLHQKFGFYHLMDLRRIGYKLGIWHDTSWWALDLNNDDIPIELT